MNKMEKKEFVGKKMKNVKELEKKWKRKRIWGKM